MVRVLFLSLVCILLDSCSHFPNASLYMDSGGRTQYSDDEHIFPGLLSQDDPIAGYLGALVENEGLRDEFGALKQMLRSDDTTWRGYYALDRVGFVRRNPLYAIRVTETNAQPFIDMAQKSCYEGLIPAMATLVDIGTADPVFIKPHPMETPESVLDFCESVFQSAMAERDKAFAAYSREELLFVYSNAPAFLNKLADHMYLSVPYFKDRSLRAKYYRAWERVVETRAGIGTSSDGKRDQALQDKAAEALREWNEFIGEHRDLLEEDNRLYEQNCRLAKLTRKTNYSALARMSQIMTVFLCEDVRMAMKDAIEKADWNQRRREDETTDKHRLTQMNGEIILRRRTPFGDMVIGGRGNNVYSNDFAVIIDPDGNDVYMNNCGASISLECPFGVLIDFKGNDQYGASGGDEGLRAGAGICGVGILADLGGDDVYCSGYGGQGFGFLGAGILYDGGGDDAYTVTAWGQGAAIFGLGALIDAGGNDIYKGAVLCQAASSTKGVGLLLDVSGNDQYNSGGQYPSTFWTAKGYDGRSQGFSMGLRSLTESRPMSMHGGMALLLDLAGNDIYKGGEFSQGGGYFFAMGMLIDGDGNDVYESQRFGTGFGVHSGVGVLLDHGAGNDRYVNDSVNALGCGWDLGCGYLVDHGGRDSYECNMLGIGAASHNGFALFIDSGGQDSYKGRGMILGYGGTNTYHGGKSLAIFLDAGSSGDSYEGKDGQTQRHENTTVKAGNVGLFRDSGLPIPSR
jgi:hypothetical protein